MRSMVVLMVLQLFLVGCNMGTEVYVNPCTRPDVLNPCMVTGWNVEIIGERIRVTNQQTKSEIRFYSVDGNVCEYTYQFCDIGRECNISGNLNMTRQQAIRMCGG